jgi:glycosyltransferase involved in cell wall biosynthesis
VSEIDIVFPCLNEASALPWVLRRVPLGAQAIVVDNGSVDDSPVTAMRLGALVVPCSQRGYGAACHAGLAAARASVVAFCDCDGTIDPVEVVRFAAALADGADLVVGRRRALTRSAFPATARLANVALARRVRMRTGLRITDVGPLRVGRRTDLLALGVTDRRFGYPVETIVRAADAGWAIAHLDVDYRPRIGRSKVTGTVRGYAKAVKDMHRVLSA